MAIEDKNIDCKMIVLDTTSYRIHIDELCAYLTGQSPDSGAYHNAVEDIQNIGKKEIQYLAWWDDNIAVQEDTEGSEYYVPWTRWTTEGINNFGKKVPPGGNPHPLAWFSVAIFVEEFPPEQVINELISRATHYFNNPAQVYEEHKLKTPHNLENKKIMFTGYRLIEPIIEKVWVEENKVTGNNTHQFKV